MSIRVIRPEPAHRPQWNELYTGYAEFYQVEQTQAMRDRVWQWINDGQSEVECFIALDDQGVPVGLAHFRQFARPLAASTGGYLDDLFVTPAARGNGAAQALITAVVEEGRRRGWTTVRWITAEDNYRARAAYDKLAQRTGWLTYEVSL